MIYFLLRVARKPTFCMIILHYFIMNIIFNCFKLVLSLGLAIVTLINNLEIVTTVCWISLNS